MPSNDVLAPVSSAPVHPMFRGHLRVVGRKPPVACDGGSTSWRLESE